VKSKHEGQFCLSGPVQTGPRGEPVSLYLGQFSAPYLNTSGIKIIRFEVWADTNTNLREWRRVKFSETESIGDRVET
jgi:hypothetical protein